VKYVPDILQALKSVIQSFVKDENKTSLQGTKQKKWTHAGQGFGVGWLSSDMQLFIHLWHTNALVGDDREKNV